MTTWPATAEELIAAQRELAARRPKPWDVPDGELVLGGCFVCFEIGPGLGAGGERAWAGAAVMRPGRGIAEVVVGGRARAPYAPGLLALREGPLLETAVGALPQRPDVLLVNATGRDHPRRCGLALHLGAVLGLPTVGVTDRPLVARGRPPPALAEATAPLLHEGDEVAAWLRTRGGVRPVAVHAAWRTSVRVSVEVVRRAAGSVRTPAPIRWARQAARRARAHDHPTSR